MNIVRTLAELPKHGRKTCVAIGFFDGVHLGHQQVIRQTVGDARQYDATSLVITFDRHPNTVVAPAHVPSLIYSLSQRLREIDRIGADALWLISFDEPFSHQEGETFIRKLADELGHIQSLCVGADFTFGYKRSGNVSLLRKLGQELNFTVHGMAAVSLDGQVVSSTRIRELVASGNFDTAGQMLGRPYSLAAKVMQGDGIGHQIGFPTANLDVTGLILPPQGVYAAHAILAGRAFHAAVNIGHRPTLQKPTPEVRVEVHLLDTDGEFHGKEMEVTFIDKLRDERKFPSIEDLKAQIARDIAETRKRF